MRSLLFACLLAATPAAGTQVSVRTDRLTDVVGAPNFFLDIHTVRPLNSLGVEVAIESIPAPVEGVLSDGPELFLSTRGLVSPPWDDASGFNPFADAETSGLHFENSQQVFASAVTTDLSVETLTLLELEYFGRGDFDIEVVFIEDGVRGAPIEIVHELPPPALMFGDYDDDGDVDIIDFGFFADAFGSITGDANYQLFFDLEPDGDVDIIDFGFFADFYGIGAAAVPEPTAVVLCLTALAFFNAPNQRS